MPSPGAAALEAKSYFSSHFLPSIFNQKRWWLILKLRGAGLRFSRSSFIRNEDKIPPHPCVRTNPRSHSSSAPLQIPTPALRPLLPFPSISTWGRVSQHLPSAFLPSCPVTPSASCKLLAGASEVHENASQTLAFQQLPPAPPAHHQG